MRYNVEHSAYTAKQNIRIHEDLLGYVRRLADEKGSTVPKALALMIERETEGKNGAYSLNPLTDIFALEHNPHESHASRQIKLYMKPEVIARVKALAQVTDTPERMVRLSLILDALQHNGIAFY